MVKNLIDTLDPIITKDSIPLNDSILIISDTAMLVNGLESILMPSKDIDEVLKTEGNFYFRTSDDFLRGLIIGKILARFPSINVFSSRVEVFMKYFGKKLLRIEPFPRDVEGMTLVGDSNPVIDQNVNSKGLNNLRYDLPINPNIPQYPEHSTEKNYVEPISPPKRAIFSGKVEEKQLASESKYLKMVQNPILGPIQNLGNSDNKPNKVNNPKKIAIGPRPYSPKIFEKNPVEIEIKKEEGKVFQEEDICENSEIIKKYLEEVVSKTIEDTEFYAIKKVGDLYGIVYRIAREIGEKEDERVYEDNKIWLMLVKRSIKKIFEWGFFTFDSQYSIDYVLEKQLYSTKVTSHYN